MINNVSEKLQEFIKITTTNITTTNQTLTHQLDWLSVDQKTNRVRN